MAELAAIWLASNFLQFAELGVRLFQLARESYESGSTAQYEALKDQARSVQELAGTARKLCESSNSLPSIGRLHEIAPKCEDAATGLMALLKRLNVDVKNDDKGYKKAWKAFAQALHHVAHEKNIKGSEENLKKSLPNHASIGGIENCMSIWTSPACHSTFLGQFLNLQILNALRTERFKQP